MKRVATVASLALAVAGVNYVGAQEAAPPVQQQENQLPGRTDTGNRANQAGRDLDRDMNRTDRAVDRNNNGVLAPGGTAEAPDAEGIRDVLAQVAQASVSEDGFDDLVERFVDADRNRIGEWMKTNDKEFDDLNTKAKAFVGKFEAKYDEDFDMDENEVFTSQFATIRQSEIGDEARTAGSRDGDTRVRTRVETRDTDRDAGEAVRDTGRAIGEAARETGNAVRDTVGDTGVDSPDTNAADANRNDPGRNIATVQIKESHGLPALTVEMIHEFPGVWKVDVPDSVSPDQLYTNVGKALDEISADESKWPQDKNEAYGYVTHKLLLAIHGKDADGAQKRLPAGGM